MSIYRPELLNFGSLPFIPLTVTHKDHIANTIHDFSALGKKITETGDKIGADAVIGTGTFKDAMLNALDRVSAHQQTSSNLTQAALLDPDLVNAEDITIAMAQANMSLNITRNVLNRLVQGWRDVINTR